MKNICVVKSAVRRWTCFCLRTLHKRKQRVDASTNESNENTTDNKSVTAKTSVSRDIVLSVVASLQ